MRLSKKGMVHDKTKVRKKFLMKRVTFIRNETFPNLISFLNFSLRHRLVFHFFLFFLSVNQSIYGMKG